MTCDCGQLQLISRPRLFLKAEHLKEGNSRWPGNPLNGLRRQRIKKFFTHTFAGIGKNGQQAFFR